MRTWFLGLRPCVFLPQGVYFPAQMKITKSTQTEIMTGRAICSPLKKISKYPFFQTLFALLLSIKYSSSSLLAVYASFGLHYFPRRNTIQFFLSQPTSSSPYLTTQISEKPQRTSKQPQKVAKDLEDIPTLIPNVAKYVKKHLILNCNFLENIIFAVVRDRLY